MRDLHAMGWERTDSAYVLSLHFYNPRLEATVLYGDAVRAPMRRAGFTLGFYTCFFVPGKACCRSLTGLLDAASDVAQTSVASRAEPLEGREKKKTRLSTP